MRAVLLGIVLGAATAAGCATEPRSADSRAEAGRDLFVKNCAACHGLDAAGGGPAAESLTQSPPDLTRIAARRGGTFPEAAILRTIDGRDPVLAHGSREMPIWGDVFRTGVQQGPASDSMARGQALILVRYLESIQVAE